MDQEFKQEFQTLRQELKQESETLRQELKQESETLRQEFKQEFEDLTQIIKLGFDDVDKRFEEMDKKITREIGQAKLEILDAVDDKLVNLKGDLIVLTRGEDKKLLHLVNLLKIKNILTKDETEDILKMQPFPQLI